MSNAETYHMTVYYNAATINRSRYITVQGGEPDLTHWTSWRDSTGEYIEQRMAFGLHFASKQSKSCLASDKEDIMLFSNVFVWPAHPTEPAYGNADKRVCPLAALLGATCLSRQT